MNTALKILLLASMSTAGTTVLGQSLAQGVSRIDLQRHDLSIEGRETVQARIEIAPGAAAPWHRHPGEEVIYILEGPLEYQLEGQPWATFEAGQVLFVPDGVAHRARNPGAAMGAEVATYIVEKGKPLLVPAPEIAEP
jgi:quercetin dioxygenase-like cupin family protein